MSTNGQGNLPPSDASVNGDIKNIFAARSPLELLGSGANTPPINPQQVANDVAVQMAVESETARAKEKALVIERAKATAALPTHEEPHEEIEIEEPVVLEAKQTKAQAPYKAPPIPGVDSGEEPEEADHNDGSDAIDSAFDGEESTEKTEEAHDEDPLADIPDEPKAENFKKLREKTKNLSQKLKEEAVERSKVQRRLAEYESGEAQPEVLKELNARVSQLEPFEKIHAYKSSKEFKQKYIEPLNHKGSRLGALTTEYKVDDQVIHDAFAIANKYGDAELDRHLMNHFGNTLGGKEAFGLVKEMNGLTKAAREGEANAGQALVDLQRESQATEAQNEESRINNIRSNSKNSWSKTVERIREEGTAKELIPGDETHNNRFVNPIQTAAAKEYGKFVAELGKLGVKELPEELANALATVMLHSHGSAANRARAVAAENYIAEIEKGNSTKRPFIRPNPAGNSGTGSANASRDQVVPGQTPIAAKDAANMQMNNLLGRK